ncbi:MAG: hypothetical protein ABWY18_05935 [Tardiphaga sp.]
MSQVRYLREQAARAERLARNMMDAVTIQRLVEASREYRQLADRLELCSDRDGTNEPTAILH